MKTTELLARYLKENNIVTVLGAGASEYPLSASDKALIAALERKSNGNQMYIIVMFTALLLILLVSFYFIFYYRDSPKIIITLFSGTTLSTFGVISRMHRIWVDKSRDDLLITSFPFLEKRERLNVVLAFCRIDDASLFSFGTRQGKKDVNR